MIRFAARTKLFNRAARVFGAKSQFASYCPARSLKYLSQLPQIHGVRGLNGLKDCSYLHDDAAPPTSLHTAQQNMGNMGARYNLQDVEKGASSFFAPRFRSPIGSSGENEFEAGRTSRPTDYAGASSFFAPRFRSSIGSSGENVFEAGRTSRPMDYVRGIIGDGNHAGDGSRFARFGVESNADIVHIKLKRNNTFVTITDSTGKIKKGLDKDRKCKTSLGCLGRKAGKQQKRHAHKVTAEHAGRVARALGVKSVVMKVNGFTFFKKKKEAILAFREGYTNSRGDQNPIVYIEDTTRKPHNGCRLPKKRRI